MRAAFLVAIALFRNCSCYSGELCRKCMRLIVGLGNPGREYELTRHNLGWMALNNFVEAKGLDNFVVNGKFKGQFLKTDEFLLLKPLTFMNLSGLAVKSMVHYYGLAPQDVLVIYDDLNLPYGELRLRAQGSPGGHHGIASVIAELGTSAVPRLRIGIGRAFPGGMVDKVLGKFSDDELERLQAILKLVNSAISDWLEYDIQKAMSYVNEYKAKIRRGCQCNIAKREVYLPSKTNRIAAD